MGETAGLSKLDRADSDQPSKDPVLEAATEIVCRFSRCANYPKTTPEMIALAQDLKQVSETKDVPMAFLAQRWAEQSAFCPTAAELLDTASEIRVERAEREAIQQEAQTRRQWVRESRGVPQDPVPVATGISAARDAESKMWRELRRELHVEAGKWPSWRDCAAAARKLGYEDYAKAWESFSA